jgi:kynurenine formamidase
MSTVKIAETPDMEIRRNRAGDDAFETVACVLIQGFQHAVRSLAYGDYNHPAVRAEAVQILADSEYVAVTADMTLKCAADSGFAHSVLKDMARNVSIIGQPVL